MPKQDETKKKSELDAPWERMSKADTIIHDGVLSAEELDAFFKKTDPIEGAKLLTEMKFLHLPRNGITKKVLEDALSKEVEPEDSQILLFTGGEDGKAVRQALITADDIKNDDKNHDGETTAEEMLGTIRKTQVIAQKYHGQEIDPKSLERPEKQIERK